MDDWFLTSPAGRIALALLAAAGYALASYFLTLHVLGGLGLVSVVFAIVQPAVISAFVAFVGDPMGKRPKSYYILSPTLLALGMIVIAALVLREGAVCIVMLAPIWLVSGIGGTLLLYRFGPRVPDPQASAATFRASALLAVPLVMVPLEQAIPNPVDSYEVSRSVEIAADRQSVWALMQSVPALESQEGRWNVTQDLVGVPRPVAATLSGRGVGAVRHAEWGRSIAFEEHVTHWQPGRAIGWDFVFPASDGWDFTDPHLRPDSDYMTIDSGGYTLDQIAPGRVRLTLHTRYTARTKLNAYGTLWGELFLGDIQSNILAVIRERAEAGAR
ncbi:SRPBCC family protein [Qipengyuania nanhaisediminis]|uniref:SRPBCC family protein n=1 Tax=Qipengyuania nanhaisediminis TaxID=604088 RepID=UPI0038B3361B